MSIKTVVLGLIVEDGVSSKSAWDYAVGLCEAEGAHLSCRVVAPLFDLPTGRILPLVHALVDQVNAERLEKAEVARSQIETACRLSGVAFDFRVVQEPYLDTRSALIQAAHASDLVILPRADGELSIERGMVQGVLFAAGRPAIVVPSDWTKGAAMRRIMVAWDGSARAARAVGDAMAFLEKADEIEVVTVVPEGDKNVPGAELAEHLSRHCKALKLTDLPIEHADAGWTLRDRVEAGGTDLLVMGAYAHSRVLQFVLGGVTSLMLRVARVPVLYAY